MIISELFVLFIFYSFLGWIWETLYCTIQTGHFQSRGFLFGPVCPIYGFCILLVQVVCRYGRGMMDADTPVWKIFLVCAAGSAVIEYSTHWYLEKRFHARWWDYSNLPLNVNGRICIPVTLCFGAGGVVIVKYVLPVFENAGGRIPGIVWEILSLLMMALFAADFALTEAELNSLLQRIEGMENEFNTRAESAYAAVTGAPAQVGAKVRSVEEEFRKRVYGAARSLNWRQKHIMSNIRSFRPAKVYHYSLHAGQKLKEALPEIRRRGKGTREERDVGDGS